VVGGSVEFLFKVRNHCLLVKHQMLYFQKV